MTFRQLLGEAAGLVEARLDAILTNAADVRSPARLVAAMRHAVLGGGKRFRPFLLMESARLFGISPARCVDAATALECVHCYSLAHDDLPAMDNDELRRGQPTVWKAFDEWTAILVGDGLLTLAFELLAAPEAHPDPAVRIELVRALGEAAGHRGMVGGQALDLEAEKLGRSTGPTFADIRHLQAMKTGALITFACEAGAILGGASAEDRARLKSYGEAIGFAFQVADDLLDTEGDAATVGKAVAKDAAAGKATIVSLIGVDAARATLIEHEAKAIVLLEPFGGAAATLREAATFVSQRRS